MLLAEGSDIKYIDLRKLRTDKIVDAVDPMTWMSWETSAYTPIGGYCEVITEYGGLHQVERMELLTTIKNNSTQLIVIMAVILLASTAALTALGGGA